MLRMVLRKMLNTPWMIICLLIGSILAVAMVSSIPMYTDGVLQRMLVRDLESYQIDTGFYPGRYLVKGSFYSQYQEEDRAKAYRVFEKKITEELIKEIGLPYVTSTRNLTMDYLTTLPEVQREEEPKKRNIKVDALQYLEDHINIIHGRLFSNKKTDDYYEVMVTEQAMQQMDFRLDEVYIVNDLVGRLDVPMKFKVVGVFDIKDLQDPYWFQGLWAYKNAFLMDFNLLQKSFIQTDSPLITNAQWYFAYDYHKMTLENIKGVLAANKIQQRYYSQYRSLEWKFPAIPILDKYNQRETQLKLILWVLQVPILLMLAFYLFMVSQLIIDNDKNEIAVMKSRGASGIQIFFSYLIESLLLSGVALLAGPPLGLLLCTVLGSSNGFLEFVQRTALPLSLSPKAYQYSLWAILLFMTTILVPASLASRTSIVQYKQKKARGSKQPIWKKLYLDVLILAIAAYGLYSYNIRQGIIGLTGVKGTELTADPLLFLISTMFIIGAGLVFLRIYPFIISLIFWLGKKIWSPVLYASFIQVGRSGGQNQFLMLFIIVTLSIGIFNANAARTTNINFEEKIRYEMGADIIIDAYWPNNAPSPMSPESGMPGSPANIETSDEPIQYQEPPFEPFQSLPGVEVATKVLMKDKVSITGLSQRADQVQLMGIIPDEFGKLAWFRQDLLPYNINDYLNFLAQDPRALLLSSSLREKFNLKEGDSVFVTWGDQGYLEGIVYAFVDYWPTYNPTSKQANATSDVKTTDVKASVIETPDIIIANYSYIRAKMALEPYEVWIGKATDATSQTIYDGIEDKDINITALQDTDQMIINMKNDPMVQGTNGVLTLGFIVTMAVSTIGFLIYWILSIQRRALNFGIFRAMGLSSKKVIGMLIWEQILISGVAIIMGILIGSLSSELFVPLLQLGQSAAQQVPPFHVVTNRSDYIRVYSLVSIMLTLGILVLGIIVSRIKIAQAIKLGED